jgi:hypothetical protein
LLKHVPDFQRERNGQPATWSVRKLRRTLTEIGCPQNASNAA